MSDSADVFAGTAPLQRRSPLFAHRLRDMCVCVGVGAQFGLNALLQNQPALDVVAVSVLSPVMKTQTAVLEIFATLSMLPGGHRFEAPAVTLFCARCVDAVILWRYCGYRATLTAFAKVRNTGREGARFEHVVRSLRSSFLNDHENAVRPAAHSLSFLLTSLPFRLHMFAR
jgi:hypothetical protein